MQRYQPPGDPNNEPTRAAGYVGPSGSGYGGSADYYTGSSGQPPGPPEAPPTPWYLKPWVLIGWGALSATLLALLVWGIIQLIGNDSGRAKSTTSSIPTTTTSASPVAPAVTTTDTASPTTTTTTEPSTTTTEPETAATEPETAATTTPPEGFHLPSEITLPTLPTVIHLPPGL